MTVINYTIYTKQQQHKQNTRN